MAVEKESQMMETLVEIPEEKGEENVLELEVKVSRRMFLRLSGTAAVGLGLAACGATATPPPTITPRPSPTPPGKPGGKGTPTLEDHSGEETMPEENMSPSTEGISADEAQNMLEEGNKRFVSGRVSAPNRDVRRRELVASAQAPFAVVLGCIDSRVPPELIFDRGLGDLLVVRTAGHVMDDAVLGSIEFGVEELKIPLLIVLGHKNCGAVKATVEAVEKKTKGADKINTLIEKIRPAVEKAIKSNEEDLIDATVHANVELIVEKLKETQLLKEAIEKGHLRVVGAYYDMDSGEVSLKA